MTEVEDGWWGPKEITLERHCLFEVTEHRAWALGESSCGIGC